MNGWVSGFLLLFIIGLTNIISKVIAHMELNSAVYVSQGMMAGAFMLLLLSRPGPLAMETVKHPNTWLYGWFFLMFNTLAIYVLRFIDVAALMQLQRFATVLTFIVVWLFLGRNKNWPQNLFFQSIILVGVIVMLGAVPSDVFGIVFIGTLFMCLLQTMKAIVVETHTPNNKAKNFEQEVRVTAFVMAVTGTLSYVLMLSLSLANSYFDAGISKSLIPSIDQFFNPYSLILASVYGVFGFSAMRFLEFFTVKKIKSEGYMTLMAFVPLFGLAFEYLGDFTGIVPMHVRVLSLEQIISLVLIVGGSIGSIYFIRQDKKVKIKGGKLGQQMERDRALASHTLEYTGGNKSKAAKLLGISKEILEVALHEKDANRALPERISNKMQDNFTKQVSFMDALTGLINKTHFLSLFKDILNRGDTGAVLFVDLNKFKPVNDTYGHEVGDEVLKVVAERLKTAARRNSVVARLGGDEFAILLTNINRERVEEASQRIADHIAADIKLESLDKSLNVGASIGVAIYPDDGLNAEKLLDIADKQMYRKKRK